MMGNKKILTINWQHKWLFIVIFITACSGIKDPSSPLIQTETVKAATPEDVPDTIKPAPVFRPSGKIETGTVTPAEVVHFAKTLIGIPYVYASTDPAIGFDCSGFVTYVFNHFNIGVPRSSVDFTNMGKEIEYIHAQPGDLILFTGTDSTIRVVGHMGIIESNELNRIQFIHSTSGKAKGVVMTPFENYYKGRFVKVIRIFPEQYFE